MRGVLILISKRYIRKAMPYEKGVVELTQRSIKIRHPDEGSSTEHREIRKYSSRIGSTYIRFGRSEASYRRLLELELELLRRMGQALPTSCDDSSTCHG